MKYVPLEQRLIAEIKRLRTVLENIAQCPCECEDFATCDPCYAKRTLEGAPDEMKDLTKTQALIDEWRKANYYLP